MVSVHNNKIAPISVKAGAASLATSTSMYKAVYWSADNAVALINTVTNYTAFAGFVNEYPITNGGDMSINGPGSYSKAILHVDSITAGNLVGLKVSTTTSAGKCTLGTLKNAGTPTDGAVFIVGTCVQGSQSGTDTVFELQVNPYFSTAITTTVA